jgi:spore maturation protein B
MLNIISILAMPLIISIIIIHGILKKVEVFAVFQNGAKDGINACFRILPSLIALFVAINMFKNSGALDFIVKLLAPLFSFLKIPPEVLPLAFMRPISGSASLAIVTDLLNTYGANSLIGRTVSVMMGSTETTFYTVAVYYAAVGVKDVRWTIKAALLADLVGILTSCWIVRLFFHY